MTIVPKQQIRILTFSTLYPNEAQPNHGIFVENRLRHLVATGGVTSVVLAPTPYFPRVLRRFGRWGTYARVPREEIRHGLAVYHPRYPVLPRVGMILAPAFLALGALATIRRIIRSGYDFDLIDAHYAYPDGVAAVWLGRWLSKPVVVTARGTDINLIPQFSVPRRLIRQALGRAAAVVTVSEALKHAVIDLELPSSKITMLRNGVDLTTFAPGDREAMRARLGVKRPLLLSVGHLIKRKGHDLIIHALVDLPEYALFILGEGPELDNLKALASSLGLETRVGFLGAQPHADMPLYYNSADALILASDREGWPNVLLEAMACGTPVIASNIWGNPEIVRSVNCGRLLDERTPRAIVNAVRDLFEHLPLRTKTREYAESFSWCATSFGQIALFKNILQGES